MSVYEPFPYMPARSTSLLLEGFDPSAFRTDQKSLLYRYLDAMVGTSPGGAGTLLNQIFVSNLSAAIDTCYFNELDYIVGNINFLARTTSESYSYDPLVDQLTSDQWDEVRIKDAWFRARIKDFFAACQLGGTPEGVRKCVSAAIASDCTIQEVWRYIDGFSLSGLGRTEATNHYSVTNLKTGHQVFFSGIGASSDADAFRAAQEDSNDWEIEVVVPRNEVSIMPHKQDISPGEMRLLREMLGRILPIETVITVDTEGLSLSIPLKVSGASADSSYYEIIKQIDPGSLIDQLPPPEFLAVELLPSEQWLLKGPPENAPWWRPNHTYQEGQTVRNVGKYYVCVVAGTSAFFKGPIGKGPLIADGTVVWERYPDDKQPKGLFGTLIASLRPEKIEAPYAAFMQTSEYSYYYLTGTGNSAIDSVTYSTLQSDGSFKSEKNYQVYQQKSTYTGWMQYQKADSPDNYPGGQFGRHPLKEPAVNPDGTPYKFPYPSQSAYVEEMIAKVQNMGGTADTSHYRLPVSKNQTVVYTYYPDYAVANFAPVKESTVTSSITRQRPKTLSRNLGNPSNFVR